MRIPSPFTSAWFRYLAIIFGLLRYLAASKARALRIGQLLCSYFPFAFSPSSTAYGSNQPLATLNRVNSPIQFYADHIGPELSPLPSFALRHPPLLSIVL